MRKTWTRLVLSISIMVGSMIVVSLSATDSALAETATPVAQETEVHTFDPFEKSIEEIQDALNSGQTTSEQLVQYYLNRIEAYDKAGPKINAVITINAKAIELAKELDEERKLKGPRSELHGIPIVVKDNYDVVGMPTTAGSVALKNAYPSKNSFVVQKLIDAGAIVIAKTNMSEFAASYGRLGYSSLGGLTLNPYNLNRDASGSSSGSAAAVASNFAVFGLGTDTSGSVRGPANVTGLVGIRPTLGLTSRSGVIPSSLAFDTTGPMARSVKDAAIALSYMAGTDKNDYSTRMSDKLAVPDYSKALSTDALKTARIGIAGDFFGDNREVDAITKRAIAAMKKQGAQFVSVSFTDKTQYLWTPILGPIGDADFKVQLEKYLSLLPKDQPKTLEEIIQISESPEVLGSATPVNPARLEGMKDAIKAASQKGSASYKSIISKDIPAARAEVQKLMKVNNLDAIVFPTMSCPASPRFDIQDPTYACDASDTYAAGYVASATGYPEITVPAGVTKAKVPVGISFLGTAYSEQSLINLAYSFEQATKARTIPDNTPRLTTSFLETTP
ncbi:amidase family protein [Paenibacillus durus]|nr:amidase family protein [Paenibacillus durus]